VLVERIAIRERAGNAVDVTVRDAVVNERLAVEAFGEILVIREDVGGSGDRDRQGRRGSGGEQHSAHARLSLYIGGESRPGRLVLVAPRRGLLKLDRPIPAAGAAESSGLERRQTSAARPARLFMRDPPAA